MERDKNSLSFGYKIPTNLLELDVIIRGVKNDSPFAAFVLAECYENGYVAERNFITAHKIYNELARISDSLIKDLANQKAGEIAFLMGQRFYEFYQFSDSLLWFGEAVKSGNKGTLEYLTKIRIADNQVLNLEDLKALSYLLLEYKKSNKNSLEGVTELFEGMLQAEKNVDFANLLKFESKINRISDGKKTLFSSTNQSWLEEKILDYFAENKLGIDRSSITLQKSVEDPGTYFCRIAVPSHDFETGGKKNKVSFSADSRLVLYEQSADELKKEWSRKVRKFGSDVNEENNQLIFKLDLRELSRTRPKSEVAQTEFSPAKLRYAGKI